MKAIGQLIPVTTLDLQLYIIAQEIRLRNWNELSHHVIRLGGFHIMELYWKILGKRYLSSGFDDILVEAGIFGPNAMTHIMAGGHYKRCSLAHMLMHEAMTRLHIQAFLLWLTDRQSISASDAQDLEHISMKVQDNMHSILASVEWDPDLHRKLTESVEQLHSHLAGYQSLLQTFNELGKAKSLTFHLWLQYIEDVSLALQYIAAEKLPNWNH